MYKPESIMDLCLETKDYEWSKKIQNILKTQKPKVIKYYFVSEHEKIEIPQYIFEELNKVQSISGGKIFMQFDDGELKSGTLKKIIE